MPSIVVKDGANADQTVQTLPSVGQKVSSGSLPVVLPSDQAALPTVADGYARIVVGSTITRLANTTAYVAGQVIGGSASANNSANRMILTGISRVAGGTVQIPRIRLYKSNPSLTGLFDIILFRGDPSTALSADAATFTGGTAIGAAASAVRVIGRFQADFSIGIAGTDGAEVGAAPRVGSSIQAAPPSGSSDLYAVIVANSNYTPTSGETFNIVAEVLSY